MNRLVVLFPLWAVLASAFALWHPELLRPWQGDIVPLLMVVMFGMGMTLTAEDFRRVAQRPWLLGFGLLLQYGIMPAAAFLIGHLLHLSQPLLVGLVLVGSCPGGTASNVVTYLARGDVALSITLTLLSTLLAVVATPLLTWAYVSQRVPVPVEPMLLSLLQIVLAPVAIGALINSVFGKGLRALQPLFPLLSMLAIVVIIAIIVALNRARLEATGPVAVLAVVLHNGIGLAAGYALARLFRQDSIISRTLAIEVGMQNSGLAVALAVKYFSAAAALPGAIFSIWHNLSGATLAAWWGRRKG